MDDANEIVVVLLQEIPLGRIDILDPLTHLSDDEVLIQLHLLQVGRKRRKLELEVTHRILELWVLNHQWTHRMRELDHPLEELLRVVDALGYLLETFDQVNDVWPTHLIDLPQCVVLNSLNYVLLIARFSVFHHK